MMGKRCDLAINSYKNVSPEPDIMTSYYCCFAISSPYVSVSSITRHEMASAAHLYGEESNVGKYVFHELFTFRCSEQLLNMACFCLLLL